MQKIDSHQHFWKFDPIRDSWIDDSMKVIKRDFMPTNLKVELEAHGISGCVTVQSDQSEFENTFQLDHASKHDFIKGVVGWVDLRAENIEERLDYYSGFDKMKGFRHVLQGETDRALMLNPNFIRGISALKKHNFTYDILIFPDQLEYACELAARFPDQKFVIDHLAKPLIKVGDIISWKKDIYELSRQDNVYCKVSGMVTEADWLQWKIEDFLPYLNVVFEAFGAKRLMFGSDWPVCLVAGGYSKMISIVENYVSNLSNTEQNYFWGKTAVGFYNL